jgi:hypothetical protein
MTMLVEGGLFIIFAQPLPSTSQDYIVLLSLRPESSWGHDLFNPPRESIELFSEISTIE